MTDAPLPSPAPLDWLTHLQERRANLLAEGLTRELRTFEGSGVRLRFRGREIISFASNDYLGLSTHPNVIAAARDAVKKYGAGATASPLICGHKGIHAKLETALAESKRAESALLFPSGYQAAMATLGALSADDASILLDKLSHASLIDGAKLYSARMRTFRHNDIADLTALLDKEAPRRCIVVVESLYSMDGDIAPLKELIELTTQRGALLLVDEAHATGVLGPSGKGALEAALNNFPYDLLDTVGQSDAPQKSVPLPPHVLVLGTLSKALGAQGGFVCASELLIQSLLMGRAHMFSTALNPGSAGAALEALKLCDKETQHRLHLAELAQWIRAQLAQLKIVTPSTFGPIIPALIGDEKKALALSSKLMEQGFYVPAVRYPTVRKNGARLRISVSAAHTREECEGLIKILKSL